METFQFKCGITNGTAWKTNTQKSWVPLDSETAQKAVTATKVCFLQLIVSRIISFQV